MRAVILKMPRRIEDCRFGRGGGVRELHEGMTRVTQNGSRKIVLSAVLSYLLRCRRSVGIEQPELGSAAARPLRQALQLGSVAIRDGAVSAHAAYKNTPRGPLMRRDRQRQRLWRLKEFPGQRPSTSYFVGYTFFQQFVQWGGKSGYAHIKNSLDFVQLLGLRRFGHSLALRSGMKAPTEIRNHRAALENKLEELTAGFQDRSGLAIDHYSARTCWILSVWRPIVTILVQSMNINAQVLSDVREALARFRQGRIRRLRGLRRSDRTAAVAGDSVGACMREVPGSAGP